MEINYDLPMEIWMNIFYFCGWKQYFSARCLNKTFKNCLTDSYIFRNFKQIFNTKFFNYHINSEKEIKKIFSLFKNVHHNINDNLDNNDDKCKNDNGLISMINNVKKMIMTEESKFDNIFSNDVLPSIYFNGTLEYFYEFPYWIHKKTNQLIEIKLNELKCESYEIISISVNKNFDNFITLESDFMENLIFPDPSNSLKIIKAKYYSSFPIIFKFVTERKSILVTYENKIEKYHTCIGWVRKSTGVEYTAYVYGLQFCSQTVAVTHQKPIDGNFIFFIFDHKFGIIPSYFSNDLEKLNRLQKRNFKKLLKSDFSHIVYDIKKGSESIQILTSDDLDNHRGEINWFVCFHHKDSKYYGNSNNMIKINSFPEDCINISEIYGFPLLKYIDKIIIINTIYFNYSTYPI